MGQEYDVIIIGAGPNGLISLAKAGASAYPGGMVLLGGGYNAAGVVADDLGVDRWWQEPEMVKRAREKKLVE